MKILVCCNEHLLNAFQHAAELCGHTSVLHTKLPAVEDILEFRPEAFVLMVQGLASDLQDYLVLLGEQYPFPAQLLLFECRMEGRCFFTQGIRTDPELRAFFQTAMNREQATLLRYPDESWVERFPSCFVSIPRREATKTFLYGVIGEEFRQTVEQYHLCLRSSGLYLFVWELDKMALMDYAVNKSIHYFLHFLRLEDFTRILHTSCGGEIVFNDISFAYILINAPRRRSSRENNCDLERLTRSLAAASGGQLAHCFMSDLIPEPEQICRAHQDFKRTCAYRFFCQEARVISNTYIENHQRWFSAGYIHETIDKIQHYLSFDIANEALPGLIRKLYLEIVKPSMSYKLYYLASDAILKALKDDLSVQLLLDSIDSPWLLLTTQLGSIEESCQRVLDCVSALARRQVKLHSISSTMVRQALRYIQVHYSEKFSVDELGKRLNVSASYLSQCFKEETGISIKRYTIMYRMQQAKHQLLSTDKSVCMVASSVGYDDYRQFSKMFKALTGVSPTECRQGAMGKPQDYPREAYFSVDI